MATTPEGKVKKAVKKKLEAAGVWYYMPAQNGRGRVGIPDFICCAKGTFLAIETKAPGKRDTLTANQAQVLDEICFHWGKTAVVDDAAQLDYLLEELCG